MNIENLNIQFIPETLFDKFSIKIEFLKNGIVRGKFQIEKLHGKAIYALNSGFFTQRSNNLHFCFIVDWQETSNLKASTCFSGIVCKNGKFSVSWLLIFDQKVDATYFSKKGVFFNDSHMDEIEKLPYPLLHEKLFSIRFAEQCEN